MAENPNSRYPTQTNAPDPDYPYGSARNVSVPGDGTGTPWEADIVNDLFGWQQQLLTAAGIIPSGNPDKVGASQYYDAMRLTGGYPGLIVPMVLNVDPATLGLRILLLDGSGVLRSNYADLDAVTYVGDADNGSRGSFYHADDAAGTIRNINGAYLILGDVRGYFLRGNDGSGVIDPETGRKIAGTQLYAMENHAHKITTFAGALGTIFREVEFSGLSKGTGRTLHSKSESGDTEDFSYAQTPVKSGDFSSNPALSSETRPRNYAVNYGIWY
jgi:hypothetical protein